MRPLLVLVRCFLHSMSWSPLPPSSESHLQLSSVPSVGLAASISRPHRPPRSMKSKLELVMYYMGHGNPTASDAPEFRQRLCDCCGRLADSGADLISSHVVPSRGYKKKLRACRQHTPPPPPHLHPWVWPGLVSLSLSLFPSILPSTLAPSFYFCVCSVRTGLPLFLYGILGGPSTIVIYALLMCVRAMRQQVQGVMLT